MSKKKNSMYIFAIAIVFVVGALFIFKSTQKTLELPFSASHVEQIELYRYNFPASTEKKVVTSPNEIESIVKTLTSIAVKENKMEDVYGATVTIFRFDLSNGTDLVINYISHGGRKGEINSIDLFDYQTNGNIGSIWDKYGENHQNVGEADLPTYKKYLLSK